MELMMIMLILFCVSYPSAADDYSNNSDINIDSRHSSDIQDGFTGTENTHSRFVHVEDEMKICSCECDKKSDEQMVSDTKESRNRFANKESEQGSSKGKDQDVVFDHIVTNIGNAYNANHGTFIAPVAGTYVLSVTLTYEPALSNPGTWGHVVINGAVVAKLRVSHEQSSQTIVVNLRAGDDVSVQNTVTDKGFTGDRYSAFSGFLLYEEISAGA